MTKNMEIGAGGRAPRSVLGRCKRSLSDHAAHTGREPALPASVVLCSPRAAGLTSTMTLPTRILCVLGTLAVPTVSAAQFDTEAAAAEQREQLVVSPVAERWRVELTGMFFREAWDMNASREHLLGASFGVARPLSPAWSVGVDTHLLHVNQTPAKDAFLPAGTVVFRWRPFRTGTTSWFVEGGGGVSYASDEVPNSGTRFNFVSQMGLGMTRAVRTDIELVGGLRWLHVSNNSLTGSARNPDIQAVGLYLGWRLRGIL